MESPKSIDKGNIAKTLIVYLGGAWVFIEAINFLIDKYDWNTTILDVLILLVIFGLPAILIYTWFHQKFTRNAIILQAINGVIALVVIVFTLVNPGKLDPTQLRLLKFKDNQKQLAESIQSIVILSFDNFTGSDESEYYVAGMHSSLITDMGQIGALRIISKTSSKFFKGVDMSIPQIASELGVDAVVEGSISCLGEDSVCVQIRLISALGEEQQLWVQDYRVAIGQILNFYNDVTKKISEEINIVLTPQEESLLAESRTVDPEAYDAYLKSEYIGDGGRESLNKALKYLNIAIEKDPDWAPLYSARAGVWVTLAQMGHVPTEIASPKMYENIGKALDLDPDLADAHFVNGMIAYLVEWNWDKGEKEFLKALAINPNDALTRIIYAHLLCILQRPEEALTQGRLALDLDPLNLNIQVFYSAVLVFTGDCENALVHLEKVVAIDPGHILANNGIQAAAFSCGDYNKAFEAAKHILPFEKDTIIEIERIFNEQGFIAAYEEIMRQSEVWAQNDFISPGAMALRSMRANQPDKAMDWLEKGYELHDQGIAYITVYNFYPLHDNPRFIAIVEKMNLPMPEK